MTNGKIKTLTDRGFGFITLDAGDGEVFFHHSALAGGAAEFHTLNEGDLVACEVESNPKGPRATSVRLQSSSSPSQTT